MKNSQANTIQKSKNYIQQKRAPKINSDTIHRDIKEKIETCLLLDKKIGLEFVPAYTQASKDKALALQATKSPAKAGQLKSEKKIEHPAWRAMLLNARTSFEQS